MEILKDENSVKIILEKLEDICGMNFTPVKTFTNPLSIARKNKRLPNTGFLAGGAICNTILSLLDDKKYPINDIDIFYEMPDNGQGSNANRNQDTNIHIAPYGELMSLDSRASSYRVIETDRDGIFNNVYVSKTNLTDTEERYQYVLKGFDINCCMVGIDLENKKLIYTKEFEEFLQHRQLLVSNPYTPAHTSLRLLKKKEELNVYLDVEKEIRYLSQVYLLFNDPYQNGLNKVFGTFFSEKYKDLYDKYKDQISEYFDLLTFIEAKTISYSKFNAEPVPKHILETWSKNSHLYTFKPKKFAREYYLDFIPQTSNGPISLRKIWNVFERSTKSEINKAKMVLENPTTRHFFFVVNGFHRCDFNEKNVEEFVSLYGGNQILINAIAMAQLNLQESLNFIRMVKTMTNRESTLFVDMIVERIVKDFGQLDKSKIMDKEFIKTIFEEEKSKRSSFMVTPLDLNEFDFKSNVYELVTEYDLLLGSRILHNCMSNPGQNYANKIKSGNCKLFVIETENNYSGVEMEYSLTGYKLRTVLGISNKQPCEKHVYIANYLTTFLNYRHWLLRSNDILEKLDKNMKLLGEKAKNTDDKKEMSRVSGLIANRLGMDDFGLNFNVYGGVNLGDNDLIALNLEEERPLPF